MNRSRSKYELDDSTLNVLAAQSKGIQHLFGGDCLGPPGDPSSDPVARSPISWQRAKRLRSQGNTCRAIATCLKVSPTTARRYALS